MLRYNLAKLAAGMSRRSEVVLRPITDNLGAVREVEKILRDMVRDIAREVRQNVLPGVLEDIAKHQATLTVDAGENSDSLLTRLKVIASRLGLIANEMVNRVLRREANKHTEKWKEQVRAQLGIDLEAVVSQEDLAEQLDAAVKRSVSLITSLADDTAAGVEKLARRAVAQGMPAKAFQKDLTKQFGIADRRAKVIARDQLATLNSDLNRMRHVQAGIQEYDWSTSHDERVRPLHRSLDGTRYRYGQSTGAEGGLPPGGPIMCRCVALAVVKFDGKEF